jgi:hypothetical protein
LPAHACQKENVPDPQMLLLIVQSKISFLKHTKMLYPKVLNKKIIEIGLQELDLVEAMDPEEVLDQRAEDP